MAAGARAHGLARRRLGGGAAGALLFALLPCASAGAQIGGDAVFRVFHRGALIGSQSVDVARTPDGWHLRGQGDLKGMFQLVLRQLDIRYDEAWRPTIMTMELASPDDSAVVHVAFGLPDGTRTDIVRPTSAQWGANQVSPDTIPLPDLVFGAYEGLAARLASASVGAELRVFVVPRFEAVMSLDGVTDEAVPTDAGPLATRRWRVTVRRPEGPTPLEIWVADGRMVRVDLPKDGMSVVRQDVVWGSSGTVQ